MADPLGADFGLSKLETRNPIGSSSGRFHQNFIHRAVHSCRDLLTDAFIKEAARACGMVWRKALFTPVVTLLSCLHSHLGGTSAVRIVEDWVNGFDPEVRRPADGSAFCKARLRLRWACSSAVRGA